MTSFAVVSTTVRSEAEARAMARALVEARLAACVQIMPVAGVYRWEGRIEEAAEHLLLCKIAASDFVAVEAAIRGRHGYDVPEIVMTMIAEGSAPYLAWLAEAGEAIVCHKTQNGGALGCRRWFDLTVERSPRTRCRRRPTRSS